MIDEIDISFPWLLLVLPLLLLLDVDSIRLFLTVDVTEDCIMREKKDDLMELYERRESEYKLVFIVFASSQSPHPL